MNRGRYVRRRDVRYRRNPLTPQRMRYGKRVMDGQSGFPTYEDLLVPDEYGLPVDPRFGGFDINDQQDGGGRV